MHRLSFRKRCGHIGSKLGILIRAYVANLHNYIFVSKSDPKGNSVLIALRDFQYVGDLGRSISMFEICVLSGAIHEPQYGSRWSTYEAWDCSIGRASESQPIGREFKSALLHLFCSCMSFLSMFIYITYLQIFGWHNHT